MYPVRDGSNIQYTPVDSRGGDQGRRSSAQQEAARNPAQRRHQHPSNPENLIPVSREIRTQLPFSASNFQFTYHVSLQNNRQCNLPIQATIIGVDTINQSVRTKDKDDSEQRWNVVELINGNLKNGDRVFIQFTEPRPIDRQLEITMTKLIDVVRTSGGIHYTPVPT